MKLSGLATPFAVGVGARIGVQIVAFVQIMLAARFVDLAQFGNYTLGWACCVISVSLVYTGVYHALLRSPGFHDDRHTGFWSMLAIGTAGTGVLAGIGLWTSGASPDLSAVFLGLAPLPLIRSIVAWNEVHLVRDGRVRLVSLYGLAGEGAALAATWIGLTQGLGVFALVWGRWIALAVEGAAALVAARGRPGLRFDGARMRDLGRSAVPLWGTSGLAMFSNYGADLILGAFLNTAAVGAYRSGARISQTAADLVYQPLTSITWSRMARMERGGEADRLRLVWLEHMGFAAIVLWPLLSSFALLAPELVVFLFDETWLAAAPVIVLLCLSRALSFLAVLLEPTMVCLGRGGVHLRVRAVAAATTLAGLLAFGRFGAEQAAGAHVLASATTAILGITMMLPALGVTGREAMRAALPAALVTALCALGAVGTAGLRDTLGPTAGLPASLGIVALLWCAATAVALRRGLVTLPRP